LVDVSFRIGVVAVAVAAIATLALLVPRLLASAGTSSATASQPRLQADVVLTPHRVRAADFDLRDQDGDAVSLKDLRGKVVGITFLDSHCTNLCPLAADQLADVQKRLGRRADFVLLVASVNPEQDTQGSVKRFAAQHLWTGDWHWWLGSHAQLASVWKAYGVTVQPSPGDVVHTITLYVVDQAGFERGVYTGTLDPGRIQHDVELLAANRA
jgi:protein SCO1/2